MPEPEARWCPHCQTTHPHVPALLAGDAMRRRGGGQQGDPPLVHRRWYCLHCQQIWDAVETPAALLDELLLARSQVEESQRQAATLRVLLAQQRGRPWDDTEIRLPRAA